MASVFAKIINNELPAYRVYEDRLVIAILALDQIQLGHVLVIPKIEANHWFDVDQDSYMAVATVAKKLGPAIIKASGCQRVLTAAIGFEVPHYHLHLIPAWNMDDLNFSKARRRTPEEMESILNKIKSYL